MQEVVEALTFMADYCAARGRLPDAETYALRLQDFGGPAKDKGRRVIEDVQRRKLQLGVGGKTVGGGGPGAPRAEGPAGAADRAQGAAQ